MKRTILLVALISGLIFVSSTKTKSYVRSVVSASGTPLSWHLTNPSPGVGVSGGKIQYEINQHGSKDIANFADLKAAVDASFQTWQNIPTTTVGFIDLGTTSLTQIKNDGHFLIAWQDSNTTVTDGSNAFVDLGGALAITFTTFNSGGEILDADMVFNGVSNTWSTTGGDANSFDIAEVATHEAGHSIGLAHSAVLSATMFPRTGKGVTKSRTVSPDDQAAASVIYPSANFSTTTGKIGGTVTGGGNIFGAHVVAMDSNGNVAAATLSDKNGNYLIEGLTPGSYSVYAEPLDAPGGIFSTDNLGSFYSTVNTSFLTTSDQSVNVNAGNTTTNNITVTPGTPAINTQSIVKAVSVNAGSFSFSNSGTTVHQGDTNMLLGIKGTSAFSGQQTIAFSGTGISILQSLQTNPPDATFVLVSVNVAANAAAGARNIIVTDGGQRTIATGAVEILSTAQSADLQVTLTATPGPVQIGQDIPETLTVVNNGPGDASQVTLSIPLPAGVALGSGNGTPPNGGICSDNHGAGPLTCTFTTLASGAHSIGQFNLAAISPASSISVTATVSSSETSDPNNGNNSSTATTQISTSSVLATTSGLVPTSFPQGSPGGSTLEVDGTGFTLASKIVFNGTQRTTNFITTQQITMSLTTSDLANAGNFNVAVFNPAPGGGTSNSQTFSVVSTASADLQVVVTSPPGPLLIGQAVAYSLTLGNAGPTAASQVTLNITLPSGAALVPGGTLPSGGTCNLVNPTLFTCTYTTLASGYQSSGQFSLAAGSPVANISVTATANSSGTPDPNPNNNSSTATNPVSSSYVLPITNLLNPTSAPKGGPGGFNLNVQGTGFTSNSKIFFNGVQRGTTILVDNQNVQTPIVAADLVNDASILVTVSNPGPGGGTSNAQTFTVGAPKQSQTITFNPITPHTFGDAPFALTATASSSLPVSFSIVAGGTGSGTINGTNLTITGAGTIIIQADQAGNSNFNAASAVQQILTVNKTNQTITFGALANKTASDPPFTLTATASSGLAVTFTVTFGGSLVNLNGNTVTLVAIGSVTIQANQAGNSNFNAATPVNQSFTISKGTALLTLNTPTQIADGNPKVATVTTAPPGLSGVNITYNGSATPPTVAGTYAVSASLNNPNFNGNTVTGSLRLVSFTTSSTSVNPGTSGTATNLPGGNPGISTTLTHAAGGIAAGLTVGVYSANPTDRGLLEAGGGYGDVKVTNSNSGDTATINYYYPSTITGANETQLQFFYFTGFQWALVKDGSGNLATKNTTDNLDGTTSGGRFTITLNNSTSTPRVNQLTGTFFSAALAIMGDCDLSGVVNISDLLFMANSLAGNITLTTFQKGACDVFNDNKGLITVQDLFTLANFLAGNTQTLPVNTGGPLANPGDTIPEAFLSPPLDPVNLKLTDELYRARVTEFVFMALFDKPKRTFTPL